MRDQALRLLTRVIFWLRIDTWMLSVRCAGKSPSYVTTPRTQPEMTVLDVKVLISSLNVPGRNVVIVRPTAMPKTNSEDHISPIPVGEDAAIPEEEAICKFCFKVLGEENVLKTNCRCKNALVHEQCTADWSRVKGNNNCDVCGQVVQNLPVILLWASTYDSVDRQESNKKSLFSRLILNNATKLKKVIRKVVRK